MNTVIDFPEHEPYNMDIKPVISKYEDGSDSEAATDEDEEDDGEEDYEYNAWDRSDDADPNFDYVRAKKARKRKASKPSEIEPSSSSKRKYYRDTMQKGHVLQAKAFKNCNGERVDLTRLVDELEEEQLKYLNISHFASPLAVDPTVKRKIHLTENANTRFILCGVAEREGNFYGRPLAWTHAKTELYVKQLTDACDAFKNTFDVPLVNLQRHRVLISDQDTKAKEQWGGKSDIYKEFHFVLNRHELEEKLNEPELVAWHARPERPSWRDLELESYDAGLFLQIDHNLAEFDDVVVLYCHSGHVIGRTIDFRRCDDVDGLGAFLVKLLTRIWCGGEKETTYPEVKEIQTINMSAGRANYKKSLAEKLLASGEPLPRPLKVHTCTICGEQIQENVNHSAMNTHMYRKHGQAKPGWQKSTSGPLKCRFCHIIFKVNANRVAHIDQVHLGIEYVKCPQCNTTHHPDKLKDHISLEHQSHICQFCGFVSESFTRSRSHYHYLHKAINCKMCSHVSYGNKENIAHMSTVHAETAIKTETKGTDRVQCPQCDKKFSQTYTLRNHVRAVHGNESDRPWRCSHCPQSFVVKPKLRDHYVQYHTDLRPYVCRSQGCTSTFKNIANLYAHEKNVHKHKFGKYPSILELVPDSEL